MAPLADDHLQVGAFSPHAILLECQKTFLCIVGPGVTFPPASTFRSTFQLDLWQGIGQKGQRGPRSNGIDSCRNRQKRIDPRQVLQILPFLELTLFERLMIRLSAVMTHRLTPDDPPFCPLKWLVLVPWPGFDGAFRSMPNTSLMLSLERRSSPWRVMIWHALMPPPHPPH